MKLKITKESKVKIILFLLSMAVTVFVVYIPYFKQGLPGHFMDTLYQMERIEGLKNSLLNGTFIPRIYPHFFNGYGYGSPLFYSDIFFTFPAVLRIAGFSATQTWKLFVLALIFVNYIVSFFCIKAIAKDYTASLAGAVALTSCQFYLVDLVLRAGLGEYMAIIILPILFVAIYDYFVLEGRRSYLFGVAFGGMLLCHSIMVFLGALFTIIIFVCALISPKYRKKVFVPEKLKRLSVAALLTVGCTAYYFLPMLEQMLSGKFLFNTPWVHLSEYLAPLSSLFALKGSMFFTANVGLGAALWLLLCYACFMTFTGNKNYEALFLMLFGLFIAVITTNIFPWKLFDNSFLNNIQFTFRLFPYAVVPIVIGGTAFLAKDTVTLRKYIVAGVVAALSLIFAVYQNSDVAIDEATYNLSDEFLATEGTMYVGKGEWLPDGSVIEEFEMILITDPAGFCYVKSAEGTTPLNKNGLNKYSFTVTEDTDLYTASLIYYKGYSATLITETGEKEKLSCTRDDLGLITVSNHTGLPGTIEIIYSGTLIQKISVAITLASIILLCIVLFRKKSAKQ